MNKEKLSYIVDLFRESQIETHSEESIYVRCVYVPNAKYESEKRRKKDKESVTT